MQTTTDMDAKSFFRSLYDFKFTSLVATRVIRVVYMLLVILYSLVAVLVFVGSLSRGSAGAAAAIIVVPIGYLLSLIWLRIFMEALIVFFGMGEDIRAIRTGGAAPAVSATAVSAIIGEPLVGPTPAAKTA